MKENGDSTVVDGVDVYDINLEVNYATIAVKIILTSGYTLNLSGSTWGLLIGFTAIDVTTTQLGTLTPDITRGVDSIFINCDIIKGTYSNGVRGQVLYSFSPNAGVGTLLHINPRNLLFLDIDSTSLTSIRVWVTDQLGRAIDFRNEGSTFMLELRETLKIK
jgi:hypothetical protein